MRLYTSEALDDLSIDLAAFEISLEDRPLANFVAWHRASPRTSQRLAIRALEEHKKLVLFGGNRSGKTAIARAILVALVLGSDHEDAREFWLNQGMDPELFPKGPDTGWIIALSSEDSREYHRGQIFDLIPKWGPQHPMAPRGQSWHAWNLTGRGQARIEFMVPGYETPAKIVFKSEDQKTKAFQGDAVRAILHDEEGKTDAIYEQCKYRLIDKDGYQIMADTPIYGRTWVYNKFVRNNPKKGTVNHVAVKHIHSIDNPYLPKHLAAELDKDPVRGKGNFVAQGDVIWGKVWDRSLHVVPRFRLPESTPLFRTIDFGTRHPFVCLYGGVLDHSIQLPNGRVLLDGTLVLYREHYKAGWELARHVARMRELEGWTRKEPDPDRDPTRRPDLEWMEDPGNPVEQFETTWADPEDIQQILQLNRTYGITTNKAKKAVKAGIDLVTALLSPDATGEPRLVVMEDLVETIREIEDYMWVDKVDPEGVLREVPSKRSDHTCDCVRYMAMGVVRSGYMSIDIV